MTVEVKKPVKRPPAGRRRRGRGAAAPAAPAPAPAAGRRRRAAARPRCAAAPVRLRAARGRAARSSGAASGAARPAGGGIVLKTLTEEEKEARARALVDANRDAEVARQRAAEDAKRRAAEDKVRQKAEEEHGSASPRKRRARRPRTRSSARPTRSSRSAWTRPAPAPQTPMARQVEEIGAARPTLPTPPGRPDRRAPPAGFAAGAAAAGAGALRRPPMRPPLAPPKRPPQAPGARREGPKRRSDKVDVGRAVEGENDFRSRSVAQQRRRLERERRRENGNEPQQKVYREVTIPETITVQELAARMSERGADVIKTLMGMGVMATINQVIDPDTAELVVTEMGHRFKRVTEGDVETGLADAADADDKRGARGRRWSPSWATSTTARPRCSTRCAPPTWRRTRRAASPSISAPTR